MSKAEDLARQYAEKKVKESPYNEYNGYSFTKQKELTKFDGYDIEQAYQDGYRQAEKDLALTWEDVQTICKIESEVDAQYCKDGVYSIPIDDVYKEVLRRFNELKGYKV